MKSQDLDSWHDFGSSIQAIRAQYRELIRELPDGRTYRRENHVLFRGQASNDWELATTLERASQERFDVLRYVQAATSCVNEIESLTGRRWNIKPFPELRNEISQIQDPMRMYLPAYEYLVYLRHHGFPSPLLDWTESPYIGAFFAFAERSAAERVAVYAYIETPSGGKSKRHGAPMMSVQGPYATTHARHFAQKAWYTVATEWSTEEKRHYFCPHRNVPSPSHNEQDVLIKITMPSADRVVALRELNDYNINHFTLFQTEDSLVRALAMKRFDIGGL